MGFQAGYTGRAPSPAPLLYLRESLLQDTKSIILTRARGAEVGFFQ